MLPTKCTTEGCTATRFYGVGMSATCMAISSYIEDGQRHRHDPNDNFTEYTCSNGHRSTVTTNHRCPVKECSFNTRL